MKKSVALFCHVDILLKCSLVFKKEDKLSKTNYRPVSILV